MPEGVNIIKRFKELIAVGFMKKFDTHH